MILRHRHRGIDHKIERTLAKQTDMRHFVISQLLEKISIIAFCLCAAASLSFVHLHCPGSAHWQRMLQLMQEMFEAYTAILQFFFAFEQFQSHILQWIFMTTSIAVDEFIQNFLLFRSRWGCQIMIQPSIVTFNTAMASPWEARLTRAPWSSRFPPWFFEEASQIPSQATLCLLEQLTTIALQPNQISSLESVKEITYN